MWDENLCDMLLDGNIRIFYLMCCYINYLWVVYVGWMFKNGLCMWAICVAVVGWKVGLKLVTNLGCNMLKWACENGWKFAIKMAEIGPKLAHLWFWPVNSHVGIIHVIIHVSSHVGVYDDVVIHLWRFFSVTGNGLGLDQLDLGLYRDGLKPSPIPLIRDGFR